MASASASCAAIFLARWMIGSGTVWGGSIRVASPLCTPASSTCSQMAHSAILPSSATASISISRAPVSNLVTTTGCSAFTARARSRMRSS